MTPINRAPNKSKACMQLAHRHLAIIIRCPASMQPYFFPTYIIWAHTLSLAPQTHFPPASSPHFSVVDKAIASAPEEAGAVRRNEQAKQGKRQPRTGRKGHIAPRDIIGPHQSGLHFPDVSALHLSLRFWTPGGHAFPFTEIGVSCA